MYNHYTPQSDGSYRRSSMPDSGRRQTSPPPSRSSSSQAPPAQPSCGPSQPWDNGIFSFLRGLLPRSIDTLDLLVIVLILLMDQQECDGISPLLTLALYFLL